MEVIRDVKVPWEMGLHMRPIAKIVELLKGFSAEVIFSNQNDTCNAKRTIQLMTLEAGCGDNIRIVANGEDAHNAVEALEKFFQNYHDNTDGSTSVY